MYKSVETYQALCSILYGTEIAPEDITDEMIFSNNRYFINIDSERKITCSYNPYFSELCDLLDVPIDFQKLNYYYDRKFYSFRYESDANAEIIVYHSGNDRNMFISFDLYCGSTDTIGLTTMGVRYDEKYALKVTELAKKISEDCEPFPTPHYKEDSDLVKSILAENAGICSRNEKKYIVRHIY